MTARKTLRRLAAVALLALASAGCAATIGQPQASLSGIQAVRQQDLPPIALGTFGPGGSVSASDDRATTVRAINTLAAPGGTFSGYLKTTIESDLRAAGRLDPNAPVVLEGLLTRREIVSSVGTGRAALAAHFTLRRDARVLLEKDIAVDATWDSSFLGAVAIPDAINNFTGLFERLSVKLLTDPDVKSALDAHAR
ncbi:MAG TPA: hypothetical protein VGB91_05090 [Rhizomicrobium sp.]